MLEPGQQFQVCGQIMWLTIWHQSLRYVSTLYALAYWYSLLSTDIRERAIKISSLLLPTNLFGVE
jgi:hypothetical protein